MDPLKQRFIELFKASGWSQAEAARRLEMTRGGVNGIVTGPSTVSAGAVKLLEMLLLDSGCKIPPASVESTARAHVDEIIARNSDAAELADKLSEIHQRDPKIYKAAKTMIESFHQQVSYGRKKNKTSSKNAAAADAVESDLRKSILAKRAGAPLKVSPCSRELSFPIPKPVPIAPHNGCPCE